MTVANVQITQVLLKRGNTGKSENYTGTRSELTHDTGPAGLGPHTLRIHDGQNPGGTLIASQAWVNGELANISLGNINLAGYATISYVDGVVANLELGTGSVGATGPQGDTGAVGATGQTGATGPVQFVAISPDTPPTDPTQGEIWWDNTSGRPYVYYNGIWVDMIASVQGPTGPTGPTGPAGTNKVAAFVNPGTFVTMDNIKATLTSSGNRGLSLATVSGSITVSIAANYAVVSGSGGYSAPNGTYTTTASSSIFGWNFTGAGDCSIYTISDVTNNRAYRITLQIGAGYNNNMISIERLI